MSEKNKNIEDQVRQQQDQRQQFRDVPRDKRTPAPDLKKFNLPKGEIIIIEVGEGNGFKVIENKAKGGRAGLRGGGICKKGMNKKAIGRNS
jgi:hypothetical protein